MKHLVIPPAAVLLSFALLASPVLCAADPPPTPTWVFPLIKGHGGVHPDDALPFRPDPAQDYRIVVDVISTSPNPSEVSHSLDRLARTMNLLAYAGVPAAHTHIVAVLDQAAGLLALKDAGYERHFKTSANPNLELLHQLKAAGVQLLVCSQAMAGIGLTADDLTPDVTVSLSALTDFVILGHQGYSYMQL